MTTSQLIAELEGNSFYEGPAFVAWNPNGRTLISVASVIDGSAPLQVWNTETDNYHLLPLTADISAYDIAWSADGTRLAVAEAVGIYIFDNFTVSSLESKAIAPFHSSIAWSPDGTKLAGAEVISGIIQVLDVSTGQVLTTIQGPGRTPETGVASLAWTNDGTILIADEFDGTVQSWNAETGELLETLSLDRQGGKFLMSLSPFGGRLALGNAAPITDRESVQASEGVIQTLANGAIQIVVPAPSLERLQAIADACNAPASVEQTLPTSDAASQLSAFVSSVEALPEGAIPPACAADLIAVAEALQAR